MILIEFKCLVSHPIPALVPFHDDQRVSETRWCRFAPIPALVPFHDDQRVFETRWCCIAPKPGPRPLSQPLTSLKRLVGVILPRPSSLFTTMATITNKSLRLVGGLSSPLPMMPTTTNDSSRLVVPAARIKKSQSSLQQKAYWTSLCLAVNPSGTTQE